MTRWSWSTGLAVAVATAMMTVPAAPAWAAAPSAAIDPAADAAEATQAPQFALDAERNLPGVVIDLSGQPIAGQLVDLHQHGRTIARATTADDGTFRLELDETARPGDYQLTVGPQTIPCRIWDAETAPPTARTIAALAAGVPAVRGQQGPYPPPAYCPPEAGVAHLDGGTVVGPAACPPGGGVPSLTGVDFITLFTVGAAGTAAVLSIVNQQDIDDLEDRLDDPISP